MPIYCFIEVYMHYTCWLAYVAYTVPNVYWNYSI